MLEHKGLDAIKTLQQDRELIELADGTIQPDAIEEIYRNRPVQV